MGGWVHGRIETRAQQVCLCMHAHECMDRMDPVGKWSSLRSHDHVGAWSKSRVLWAHARIVRMSACMVCSAWAHGGMKRMSVCVRVARDHMYALACDQMRSLAHGAQGRTE
uniref:Uncharacterized protein n=1 Tax=Chlamydomonas euryale TaxID=1486919 RepID=A0A7R9VHP2_9CHLO|mmetsp:Transcript_34396/g.102181  ORF Transcript_34396/g.102181 Transcript_34396/m.102181 type:complete len:111 (+) Transcript_34396:83-415(+)|eukprot:356712-Chlamydomonas_euryale.AAC.7